MDASPYYEKSAEGAKGEGPYIDDQDYVDIGPDDSETLYGRDFPRPKANFPYGPQNSCNPFAGNTN